MNESCLSGTRRAPNSISASDSPRFPSSDGRRVATVSPPSTPHRHISGRRPYRRRTLLYPFGRDLGQDAAACAAPLSEVRTNTWSLLDASGGGLLACGMHCSQAVLAERVAASTCRT